MDFWYYFQIQKEKLSNVPDAKLNQLTNEQGQIISDCKFFKEFREHLPLTPDEFWQTALQIIGEYDKDKCIEVDDYMIQYILILVNFYTDLKWKTDISDNSLLLACEFYFSFLNAIGSKYFSNFIHQNVLNCFSTESVQNKYFHNALRAMRQYLTNIPSPRLFLEETLHLLCHIIENNSTKIYSEFPEGNSADTVQEALCCIKALATKDLPSKYHLMVNYALLHGIISDQKPEKAKKNFRNLIIDLKSTLRRDNFNDFQNVFLYIVVKSKTFDPMESNTIMLILGEQFFKETIFKLTTMGVSKEIKNKSNILKLCAVFLENLPTNIYEQSKLDIFIQTVFNILVMNCINSEEAIHLVSKICLLSKPIINKQFESLLNSPTEYIYVENSLPTFCMKFNVHWTNRLRNRSILVIILRIMCLSFRKNTDKEYAGILAMLANEADPSDMKISIPILINLYAVTQSKESKYVSDKIIEIMYNMALHSSSSSIDFVKTLFQLAIEPSGEVLPFKTKYIRRLTFHIMNDNGKLISKVHELKLLQTNAVKKLMCEIIKGDYDYLKLTCAVLEKSESPQGEQLVRHILDKTSLLTEAKYTADLLFIVNCSLKYFITFQKRINLTTAQQSDMKNFRKLLWDCIMKFCLPHNALGNAFDVLNSLSKLLLDPLNFQEFFQIVNSELKKSLLKVPEECNVVPIMYAVELITNKNYSIAEDAITDLEKALEKISELSRSQDHVSNTKLEVSYYCCISLMVRLAMSRSKLGSKTMAYLKSALNSKDPDFKMKVMDLMYDLCTYVVHNFEEFLEYSFQDLKSSNLAVRKQAVVHIEHFIRLDYLKLSIQQYCKFISLLGNSNIEQSLQNILVNFVTINQPVVEKNFLPLVMHINLYSVHPVCPMSQPYVQDMKCMIGSNFNKWKIFSTLFRSLSQRSRFLILKEICNTFFEKFIQGELKIGDGIWNVLTDAISLFKIMAYTSLDNIEYETFYEKGINEIKKYLIDKKTLPTDLKSKYPEVKDTIEKITHQLLHLLFYTDNEDILKNYKLKLFEAIIFWTHDLLPDIAGNINFRNDRRTKEITNYYIKLKKFYEKHKQCLNVHEYISEYNECNI